MYRLARPLLFRLEAEQAHDLVMAALGWCARHPGALRLLETAYLVRDPRLAVERFGLRFANPIGLAAGFDKQALAVPAWPALGFGHVEVGSVTAEPQAGNPRPRLFRLPEDGAVINRMGFNNVGARVLAARMADWRRQGVAVPVGINVGKTKVVPLEQARDDYLASLGEVWQVADYLVLNVSSPNTPGLRDLQEGSRLATLLEVVAKLRRERGQRPVLVKVAPDLGEGALEAIVAACEHHGIDGIIATNTTTSRRALSRDPGEPGGLSGRPLRARALEVLRFLRCRTELPIVSVGGIATVGDAVERFEAGASLLQLYTAFIYRGPGLVKELNRGLLSHLERSGLTSVEQLIGRSS